MGLACSRAIFLCIWRGHQYYLVLPESIEGQMKVSGRQGRFLQKVINKWREEGTLNAEEAAKLSSSYTIQSFDWKKLAKYSFWIAIVCGLISVSAAVADDYIIHFIENLFESSNIALCVSMQVIAGVFYYLGLSGRVKKPEKEFRNEALIFIGVLFTAGAIFYFGRAVDKGSGHYSLLFLIATFIYGIMGLGFPSQLVWVFALLSLGAWFGTETGYASGWGPYFMGMNYPSRFVLFGAVLVAAALIFKYISRLTGFYKSSLKLGLLYLFIALWMLSIFGNYGDIDKWGTVKQIELLPWALLFGAVAGAAILLGIITNDPVTRGFGITFLFINLYTRYFEYCWNEMHKAVFFFLLAMSFWLVGSRAEKIWNVGTGKEITETASVDEILEDEE